MKKKTIIIITIVGILVAGYFMFTLLFPKKQVFKVETDVVGRGTISNTVTATGALEAVVTVTVGTQVSGKITDIFVDYNSTVEKGQLIAMIDTLTLSANLQQSRASLDQAQAEYDYQSENYERYKKLMDKQLIARSDYDQVAYNYKTAAANLKSANASYDQAKANLGYAYIYAPINGIVLARAVEVGETVAASMSTPELFTIAKDLKDMRIKADVDEADIGQLRVGQRVEFYVDAFFGKIFEGEITDIYRQGVEASNVITYTVVVSAPNPDEILMPTMTANLTFFVTEKKNIVVIPNRAFEFRPDNELLESFGEAHPEITVKAATGETPQTAARSGEASQEATQRGETPQTAAQPVGGTVKTAWVKTNNSIFPQTVVVGETDEINYEVLSGITEGTEIITSITAVAGKAAKEVKSSKSPFMPTPPGGRR